MSNKVVFGKSMGNVRKWISIEMVSPPRVLHLMKTLWFKYTKDSEDQLPAVVFTKTKLTLDKPIYIGQAILDLSKTLMHGINIRFYGATVQVLLRHVF